MKKILEKIDNLFSHYLGLEKDVISPNIVKLNGNELFITNTESFKRHSYTYTWNEFSSDNLKRISDRNKKKLGIAIGKVIAKNLVISFDDVKVKSEDTHE